jgi:hypothetical protein
MPVTSVTVSATPSTLDESMAQVTTVLGREFPDDFAALYRECDGFMVNVEIDGKTSHDWSAAIASLSEAFDDWKLHQQSSDVDDYNPSFDEPFCETIWSPDAEVDDDESLARMNQLRRSKLLLSVPGAPEWIVVDFTPEDGDYQLLWVYEGSETQPLALDLPAFLRWVRVFGAARWYWAFLPRDHSMGDFATTREALAAFAPFAAAELEALANAAEARP